MNPKENLSFGALHQCSGLEYVGDYGNRLKQIPGANRAKYTEPKW
jgi:hypothetical protein